MGLLSPDLDLSLQAGTVSDVAEGLAGADAVFEQNRSHLLSCAWLAELPDAERDELARVGRRRIHRDGEVLFRVGDASDHVWLICAGKVQASSRSRDGREFIVHLAGPGETPGHLDLIDREARTVDARAVGETETLMLPAGAIRSALLGHPPALMRLTQDLVAINRKLSAIVADVVLLDLHARLAKLLLARRIGAGSTVELGGSQAELAAQLGVARQSLNRALGELKRQGLIGLGGAGRSIEILDADRLLALAAGETLVSE